MDDDYLPPCYPIWPWDEPRGLLEQNCPYEIYKDEDGHLWAVLPYGEIPDDPEAGFVCLRCGTTPNRCESGYVLEFVYEFILDYIEVLFKKDPELKAWAKRRESIGRDSKDDYDIPANLDYDQMYEFLIEKRVKRK